MVDKQAGYGKYEELDVHKNEVVCKALSIQDALCHKVQVDTIHLHHIHSTTPQNLFSNKVDSDHDDKSPHNDVVHSSKGGCKEEDTDDPDQYNKAGCTCAFHMTVSSCISSHT